MSWGEAVRLTQQLTTDPESRVYAALAEWRHPIDRAALVLMDLYDRFIEVNGDPKHGRPEPHPGRPFAMRAAADRRFGNTAGRTRDEVVEILSQFGHKPPV